MEPAIDAKLWAPVKDNAIFLSVEQPAWLALLGQAQRQTLDELAKRSVGTVAYAQLINQPDVYRGQSVRVSGRLLRQSTKPAPANAHGIKEYHQLWLAPRGGGEWPFVIYSLDLPAGFPRGSELSEDVAVDGLFFKNWSFPYEGGMGLAPVLVTPTLRWTPPVATQEPGGKKSSLTTGQLAIGAILAITASIAFVVWAVGQTRRPRRRSEPTPEFAGLESES
jgi:hypothetical protein